MKLLKVNNTILNVDNVARVTRIFMANMEDYTVQVKFVGYPAIETEFVGFETAKSIWEWFIEHEETI